MLACAIAGQAGNAGTVEVNWIYDEERPFEVRLQAVTGTDIVVSRDTLSEAFSQMGTAGIGWITFLRNGSMLYLGLRTKEIIRTIGFPADEVEGFLKQTYGLVPWGSESYDVDSLLEDFYNDKI
jgi:hypothetical protein